MKSSASLPVLAAVWAVIFTVSGSPTPNTSITNIYDLWDSVSIIRSMIRLSLRDSSINQWIAIFYAFYFCYFNIQKDPAPQFVIFGNIIIYYGIIIMIL